jgi:sugar phosphate isomerase/epimerase
VGERIRTLDAVGLKTVHIYATAKLKAGAPGAPVAVEPALAAVVPLLKDHGVQIAFAIQDLRGRKPSDAVGDAEAVDLVRQVAAVAEPVGATVVLYPHVGFWMERSSDALRVARQVDRPNVGVMWNLCHWLRAEGDGALEAVLRDALPYLKAVSINGSDTRAELAAARWPLERWIRPLGQGSFDVAMVLAILDRLGWQGPVCLQCYGIRGDARDHLAASMAAWRRLNLSAP